MTYTTQSWADGVRSYGNSIKDSTNAKGPRAPTGTNPLGLASTAQGAVAQAKGIAGGMVAKRGAGSNPLGL